MCRQVWGGGVLSLPASVRVKKLKAETDSTWPRRMIFLKVTVLYFGWPNQPSSGTMRRRVFMEHILVISEIRKTYHSVN